MPAAPQGPGGSSGSLILTTGSTVAESLALGVPGGPGFATLEIS
jgi:hypothetical protein